MRAIVEIKNIYYIAGIGAILEANVISGPISRGMCIKVNGKIYRIVNISVNKKPVEYAEVGNVAALKVEPGTKEDYKILKKLKGMMVPFGEEGVDEIEDMRV